MTPDWLGSPQHFVAGAILTPVVARMSLRHLGPALATLAGVVATMAAEAMVELAEYPVLYGTTASVAAYYDTIADIALTLLGALLGGLVSLLWLRQRSAPPSG